MNELPPSPSFIPDRFVSGGQTGVDRAGLEVAIALGIEHGGWCPRGRLSEDGSIPSRYQLVEMDSPEYPPRTEQNIIDSDATLILYEGRLGGGTLLTRRLAKRHDRPTLCLKLETATTEELQQWLTQTRPRSLNVAGPRESNCPGIEKRAFVFLLQAFV
ncbi:putative molybdenum carrier protein [Roseiconus lacunae]|uniref:Molybdenum carrier protein n=1 Tax=Roseiconus lacunae TaxID=2605694 RepID=A0ABT7PCS9_9BACT|nr:putative molybdenum carrier protein [Roseiconus lacunae]MDM4014021.1 putative molybdenum carrier protein [Roseiconus lacunae]WRQ53315.1 putative molybdenum carrier protein [Stieleria sp. HD01]